MPLRRPQRDDDDEPRRPRAAAAAADDDGYDPDPEDEPEDKPRRGLRGARVDNSKANKAFRAGTREGSGREDDEDDDEQDDDAPKSVIKKGWAAAKKVKAETGSFADDFKFSETPTLVKFLDSDPTPFKQHWIESGLTSTNKKSFVCMDTKDCPLCKIGDEPQGKFAFPLAVIDDEVTAAWLIAGVKLLGQLEATHNSKQTGPLDKQFYALSRTGKKGSTAYTISMVKARDLKEDWDFDLDEVEDELAKLKMPSDANFRPMAKSQLRDLARELLDEDD